MRVRIGLCVAGLAVLALVLLSTQTSTPRQEVTAMFADASGLRTGDPVRVGGVKVGTVDRIDLEATQRATRVVLDLDPDLEVHADATALLRWGVLLGGESFIALDPGSAGTARAPGAQIPVSRTMSQVTFDDVTQVFDGDTPAAVQATLRELRAGLRDSAPIKRGIAALSPTMRASEEGFGALRGERDDDVRALVGGARRMVAALNRDGRRLRGIVRGAAGTLRVTAARSSDLRELLDRTPTALDSVTTNGRRLQRTLDRLDPVVAALRPGARRLDSALRTAEPALRETDGLLRTARPVLRRLHPSLAKVKGLSRNGDAFVRGMTPVVERLDGELLPWLARTDEQSGLRTIDAIGPTMSAVSSSASNFDSNGYILHFPIGFDERLLRGLPCEVYLTDPTATELARCDALAEALARAFSVPMRTSPARRTK